ncbi:MAG: hypothetical protein K1X66_09410 [Verrucomicrobiae bacterium]|nr:hypothetical protein [Verrucomicrobiae bacterium]
MKNGLAFLIFFGLFFTLHGEEQQSHGLDFERKVIDQMLGRTYTEEWDIPAAANRIHPNVPGSIKFIKWNNAIYLGDALRQITITKPFELVVGFYDIAPSQKALQVLAVHSIIIQPEKWRELWGSVKPQDIQKLQAIAKIESIEEAREAAKKEAARLRSLSGGMDINPKINSEQRRIQCSIPFAMFYRVFLKDSQPEPQKEPMLWGRPFPHFIPIGERSREALENTNSASTHANQE